MNTRHEPRALEAVREATWTLLGANQRNVPFTTVKHHIQLVLESYQQFPVRYDHRQVCYRARKCDESPVYGNVRQCLNPPGGSKKFGRASRPSQEIIYSSWNVATALDEIDAKEGDVVQIIGMNIRPNKHMLCHIVGDIERFNNSGRRLHDDIDNRNNLQFYSRANTELYIRALVIDSFLREMFGRRDAQDFEHQITAEFADLAYRENYGFLYPSVRVQNAINISFTRSVFRSKFQVLFVAQYRISKVLHPGIAELEPIQGTFDIGLDGTINWESERAIPIPSMGRYFSPEPPKDALGWCEDA